MGHYKTIWFSRHPLTDEQFEEICLEVSCEDREDVIWMKDEASKELTESEDVYEVIQKISKVCRENRIREIFGVFPVPVLSALHYATSDGDCRDMVGLPADRKPVTLLSAWNVRRTVEGGPATFQHKAFCRFMSVYL